MGEPARKLEPEDERTPHVPPAGREGRVIRLPRSTVPEDGDGEAWVLRAIMGCYGLPR